MSTKCKKKSNNRQYKRTGKSKYVIMTLILLFLVSITIYLLLFTDFFMVEEIKISGNVSVEQKELIRISNLDVGMNIFKFNREKVENTIISHPLIKDATITRTYPNKVIIRVVEREICGTIPFEDGNFIYIDDEGYVMEKSQTLKSFNSPIITGLEDVSFIMGQPINIQPSWLGDSVLNTISSLKKEEIIQAISEIHILQDNNLQLYTYDGSVINIGDDNILKNKMSFIKSFLEETHPKVIVDISHGGDPVYKPRAN